MIGEDAKEDTEKDAENELRHGEDKKDAWEEDVGGVNVRN